MYLNADFTSAGEQVWSMAYDRRAGKLALLTQRFVFIMDIEVANDFIFSFTGPMMFTSSGCKRCVVCAGNARIST